MRPAQQGVVITHLEVTVDCQFDDRGLLGMDDAIPADGASAEQLCEIVARAEAHSPVADAIGRAVPKSTEVEIV